MDRLWMTQIEWVVVEDEDSFSKVKAKELSVYWVNTYIYAVFNSTTSVLSGYGTSTIFLFRDFLILMLACFTLLCVCVYVCACLSMYVCACMCTHFNIEHPSDVTSALCTVKENSHYHHINLSSTFKNKKERSWMHCIN